MANLFGAAFRDFWHTMTSYDRHSTYDSPQRSGRHVPLQDGRTSGLFTGVATASDSRPDVSSPFYDEHSRASPSAGGIPGSPGGPYSPGLRSMAAKNASQTDGFEVQSPGEVPMQSFEDGQPPPPPIRHSWRRIDAWAEENYPELFDQLGEGATVNDLNELEHQLDCSLPQDVRESLMVHDGQERGGYPTGIIFGSMLLDCEEIVHEFQNWRIVNQEFLAEAQHAAQQTTVPSKAFGGGSSEASSSRQRAASQGSNPDEWRHSLLSKQDCVPPNAVRKAYAHPAWIPLVRDWGGNNIAVDLAPGPKGRWGQIIMFGRDYDTKYVVARSWSAFIASVADDLNSGKWFVDEDTNELKLREFRETRVEPGYFSILRWRMDQKYGRRAAQRRSMAPQPRGGAAGSPLGSRSSSPYASPVDGGAAPDARGRSMQRLRDSSPLTSPMRGAGFGKPPALGRVTEETPIPELMTAHIEPSKLVEVETPLEQPAGAASASASSTAATSSTATPATTAPTSTTSEPAGKPARPSSESKTGKDKENVAPEADGKTDETMKEIEI
ncbi:SMI1 / KNR4 family (SUKH-1) [Geosmithia morbida]|uniref:SMI1 / KNR4 family (SUKH-1) n=1 Tax=Geosmithia morbida TaxID=1094350 RepID=A0A9P5D1J8_9HYPO|nr:SMI1 / KNR4 family (SUKH-1) [Geosmithia morbida]KAF4120541.1 SMI1 / KNR4 family (SUKH-1) [Geosmithia morbida]